MKNNEFLVLTKPKLYYEQKEDLFKNVNFANHVTSMLIIMLLNFYCSSWNIFNNTKIIRSFLLSSVLSQWWCAHCISELSPSCLLSISGFFFFLKCQVFNHYLPIIRYCSTCFIINLSDFSDLNSRILFSENLLFQFLM